jgi:hypothetical protein
VPAEARLALRRERGDALAGVVGTVQHRADRLLELEPGPFLDDLDAIYRRRWSVPACEPGGKRYSAD